MESSTPLVDPTLVDQIEAQLIELITALTPDATGEPGRPRVLPAALLWSSLVIGVLRGAMSQAAIWRVAMQHALWRGRMLSDEAIYKRLRAPGPSPLEAVFVALTAQLQDWLTPWMDLSLAPWADDVVALDETTLDPVVRKLPIHDPKHTAARRLPGKLAAIFDIRRQQFRTIQLIANPRQNEKVAAWDLAATLAPGTLVLVDLGYFSFRWFDELTERGIHWISRERKGTSYTVDYTAVQTESYTDEVVWLGAYRADRSKHLVRRVSWVEGATWRTYLTNVLDPTVLPPQQITALYARRWDIEIAVNLVKTELNLHLLWSRHDVVIHHQIWAVLLIAQILQALRMEIAGRAAVEPFEVSMTLMIQELPGLAAQHDDPIAVFIAVGRALRYIRPSRRLRPRGPDLPATIKPIPPDLIRTQTPRYAERRCGPNTPRMPN